MKKSNFIKLFGKTSGYMVTRDTCMVIALDKILVLPSPDRLKYNLSNAFYRYRYELREKGIELFQWVTERLPLFYSVTVYEICQCYGGPEEGGWYYDQVFPVKTRFAIGMRRAEKKKASLEALYDISPRRFGVYDYSSVYIEKGFWLSRQVQSMRYE